MCRGTGFREAVALLDGDFQTFVDCVYEIASQGSGAGVEHADRGEVVIRDNGRFTEHQDDRWDDVGECDAELLDVLAELLETESRHDY